MRKVIFGINVTVDGCCDHTKVGGSDDIQEYFAHHLRDVGLFAFGRKTYELMVPFWPDVARNHSGHSRAMNEFAQAFVSVKEIVVFSHSLEMPEAKNTRIVREKPQDEIRRLKQAQGKSIWLGGVTIPSLLIEHGLVDEFHLVVHPVVVGEGRRLLEGGSLQENLQLKLAGSKIFQSGSVALHYLKR